MERRSPTGIARQRETRPNNPAPDRAGARNPHHQRHAPPISRLRTHASPTAQNHGVERRSPTGIARERETRPNNPAPHQSHAYKPTHRQPRRITGTWSAGLRPASRGSAKPAPTTPPPTNLTPANPRIANRAESRDMERRSPTGIARERETRPNDAGPANLTPTNPRIANRAESRGHGAPVSDRHRAGARNPHQRPRPRQSHAYKPTHRQPRRITGHGAPVSDRHRAGARNPHQRPRPPTSGQSSRWGPARAGLRPAPGPSVRGFPH